MITVGQQFGRLTVVAKIGTRNKSVFWKCSCSCGRDGVEVRAGNLMKGDTQSCGCLRKEVSSATHRTHGESHSPVHERWMKMRRRCSEPTDPDYPNYGERGITVCQQWAKSYEQFAADMGPPPSPEHTLERRDVNGNYSPDNCYWALRDVQNNNKRNNVVLELDGKRLTLSQWARELGVNYSTLRKRIQMGWSDRETLLGKG